MTTIEKSREKFLMALELHYEKYPNDVPVMIVTMPVKFNMIIDSDIKIICEKNVPIDTQINIGEYICNEAKLTRQNN